MAVIDSDVNVLESPAKWEYLRGDEVKYKPMIVSQSFGDLVNANDGVNVQENYRMIGPRTCGKDRNVGNGMTRQIREMEDRFRRNGWDWDEGPLRENNIFVACENSDDLPYIPGLSGEDNLVVGTDYEHHDPSSEVLAVHKVRDDPRVDPSISNKIFESNAAARYGLK